MRVLLFGTFDHLHPGHRFVLDEAVKRGDLTVIIARDTTVQKLKGKPPVEPEQERMAAVQQAVLSARVLLGDSDDYLRPVRKNTPELILLGYDQVLPPGVDEADLPCPVQRLPAFHPELFKSSLKRKE